MLKWHKINEDIPDGDFVKQIIVGKQKFCMVRDKGRLYVVQNSCPHAGGILSGGWCVNGHLVCPVHRWEYRLDNGRGAVGQGDSIDSYPIETRTDGCYVGIGESWIKRLFQ